MDRFDRYSKTVYCACVLYVTLGITTVPLTAIFNESSTLMFSAVTKSTPVIFSQVALKLMRILHDKNYQNWSSGFGETCLVRFLRSDRYSVPRFEWRSLFCSKCSAVNRNTISMTLCEREERRQVRIPLLDPPPPRPQQQKGKNYGEIKRSLLKADLPLSSGARLCSLRPVRLERSRKNGSDLNSCQILLREGVAASVGGESRHQ